MITPKRRQELSLGAMVAGVVGGPRRRGLAASAAGAAGSGAQPRRPCSAPRRRRHRRGRDERGRGRLDRRGRLLIGRRGPTPPVSAAGVDGARCWRRRRSPCTDRPAARGRRAPAPPPACTVRRRCQGRSGVHHVVRRPTSTTGAGRVGDGHRRVAGVGGERHDDEVAPSGSITCTPTTDPDGSVALIEPARARGAGRVRGDGQTVGADRRHEREGGRDPGRRHGVVRRRSSGRCRRPRSEPCPARCRRRCRRRVDLDGAARWCIRRHPDRAGRVGGRSLAA